MEYIETNGSICHVFQKQADGNKGLVGCLRSPQMILMSSQELRTFDPKFQFLIMAGKFL